MRRSRSRTMLAVGLLIAVAAGSAAALLLSRAEPQAARSDPPAPGEAIPLPPPRRDGPVSVEEALASRRSVRSYRPEPLSLAEVAQLLWAAQGVTDARGYRTAPSAGALYPLEVYLVCGRVDDLGSGVYRYDPDGHALRPVASGDAREALARAALGQSPVRAAPVDLVMTGVAERTTGKYGYRGHQYVHMEAGHAAENVYLQASALGLGTVAVGAFDDAAVGRVLHLPGGETPLYIMPVGRVTASDGSGPT